MKKKMGSKISVMRKAKSSLSSVLILILNSYKQTIKQETLIKLLLRPKKAVLMLKKKGRLRESHLRRLNSARVN